jgi:phosphoglycolate phosphatase-like HAD superfamily hydrolase
VKDFLERNKERYAMYIVSGTPEGEIREIVKKRDLDIYFSGVYGSPKSKKDLIEFILKENGYTHNEVIFIGDSINDYEGARGSGVRFVAMISADLDKDMFSDVDIKHRVTSIKEFEELLAEII